MKKIVHEQQNAYDLSSSPNGQMVALVGDGQILIWDAATFRSVKFPYTFNQARHVRFSHDNKYIGISTTSAVEIY